MLQSTSVNPMLAMMRQLPTPAVNRLLVNLIGKAEGVHGLSHTLAVKDTLVSYVPKMTASRSGVERSEITIQEFIESGFVYYSIPLSARFLFQPLFLALAPKQLKPAMLSQPLSHLLKHAPHQAKYALPVKLAITLSSLLSVALCGEYALTFFKNLSTIKFFHRDRFSDVVGLSRSRRQHNADSRVAQKAKNRIYWAGGISLANLLLCAAVAKVGWRSKQLVKACSALLGDFSVKRWPKPILRFLETLGLVKSGHFMGLDLKGELSHGKNVFQIKNLHNWLFIANAFTAYTDACRDRLEKVEVVSRLAITMSFLLGFGNFFVEKIHKTLGRRLYPSVLKPGDRTVMSLRELWGQVLEKTPSLKTWTASKSLSAIERKTLLQFAKTSLSAKVKSFFIPEMTILLFFSLANNLNARTWTAYRYHLSQKTRALEAPNLLN